jgi:hypothetical protein
MSDPDAERPNADPDVRAADPSGDPDSPGFDDAEAESVRNLLRGTLDREGHEAPDVLRGVQRKIRQRSRGKFYADGWSTAKNPPIATYLLTSLAMLLILGLVYSLFGSLAGDPEPVHNEPAPVHIVIPRAEPSRECFSTHPMGSTLPTLARASHENRSKG